MRAPPPPPAMRCLVISALVASAHAMLFQPLPKDVLDSIRELGDNVTEAEARELMRVRGVRARGGEIGRSGRAQRSAPALGLDHGLCFDPHDQVGGMDATLMNGATCTPGEGVVFDGVDGYVDLADVPLGGPMTIAFWARWDALNSPVRFWRRCT